MVDARIQDEVSRDRSWELLQKKQGQWVKNLTEERISNDFVENNIEVASMKMAEYLFQALSPRSEQLFPKSKDFEVIKRLVSSIIEVTEENILTESEANVLLELLISKFIERRLDSIMQHIFEFGPYQNYSLRIIKGTVK